MLLIQFTTLAQAPDTLWTKTFGFRPSQDHWSEGRCVQQTPDGGYIIAGYTDTYCIGWYYADICVIKTSETGETQWMKTYGEGYKDETCKAMQPTSDGGWIITGTEGWGTVWLL